MFPEPVVPLFFGRGGGSPDFELEDDVDLMETGGLTKKRDPESFFFPSQESDTEVGSWKDEQARAGNKEHIKNHPESSCILCT